MMFRLRFRGRSVGVTLCALGLAAAGFDGPSQAQRSPEAGDTASRARFGADNYQSIGPGKVRFSQTRDGRWIEFTPLREGGESLLNGGGFVVCADYQDILTEIAHTGTGKMRVTEAAAKLVKCQEGMQGGFRAPSLAPDDDRDGRIDEDPLDGIDNDQDGAVDEDFAAIGDEMIVTCYKSGNDVYALSFHQETYAWSLPHVDGAIMLSLRIKNDGPEPLNGVRIVAYYDRAGRFAIEDRSVEIQRGSESGRRGVERATTVVTGRYGKQDLALTPFPVLGKGGSRWASGYVESASDLLDAVKRLVSKDRTDPAAPVAPSEIAGENLVDISAGATVFVVSPNLGRVAPGEEVRVGFGLATAVGDGMIDAAASNMLKTYLGDGLHHYLPPPVSMTPRVFWGRYYAAAEEERAVAVDLDEEVGVSLAQISSFSGLDPSSVEKREILPGVFQLVLRGDVADDLLEEGERATLKGRLETGEFFELIIQPGEEPTHHARKAVEADAFWRTPGKLDQEFLQGSPNPFRGATNIVYEIPTLVELEDGVQFRSLGPYETSVKVYNVRGRLVTVLVEGQALPGSYTTEWLAVDDNGSPVASGVYYIKLQIEKRFITKRLILLK